MTTTTPKDKPSPRFLNKEEMKILQEPEVYRKRGEKVEEALYRDYIKRTARSKLIKQTVSKRIISGNSGCRKINWRSKRGESRLPLSHSKWRSKSSKETLSNSLKSTHR